VHLAKGSRIAAYSGGEAEAAVGTS